MHSYIKKKKLGEGTYATVYLATATEKQEEVFVEYGASELGNLVAIKKCKKSTHTVGHDISAYREIKSLKRLTNMFVINLIEVFIHENDIHMVLDYHETDLEAIIRNKEIVILPADVKSWMKMILTGLHSIHELFIIHRDLKPNNILMSRDGIIKIADFGMARAIGEKMTPQAVTRWYRPPELLLGSSRYSTSVDMWSVGCIFAELLLRVPLFAGESDLEQLNLIYKVWGTPNEEEWDSMRDLPGFMEFSKKPGIEIQSLFSAASPDTLDLMKKFFIFNPEYRINCEKALEHEYFSNSPSPTDPHELPFYIKE
ncbi:putative serine/threonine-protein kinase KIN28 like protein [Nosema granulosis]|uniref:[RNA-polymerase]-subunit kinase n=1 Tax=Nosema granulosis TaxID=83296 RepID=A0A9P6KYP8_9MICR|nr:putative serine/threonine-protein kinase KIN28 like protein [Nosema granulosis]